MQIKRVEEEILRKYSEPGYGNTIFTTCEWIQFLKKNQHAEPVVLEMRDTDNQIVGYFVGLIIRKFGIRILGSPFEGWLTPDMGFIRLMSFDINDALRSVAKLAFRELKCWYIQITDKSIYKEDLASDIRFSLSKSLNMDISRDADELFSSFTKSARQRIRQFKKRGATIKNVPFDHAFAAAYYDQLIDVFAKQGLQPNYDKQKITDMVDALKEHQERVLAIQVISPEGKCIASAIFLGFNSWCYSLATASYREDQHYLPNESIRWYGINYWRDRKVPNFDLVGYREYKLKFAPAIVEWPTIVFAKYGVLVALKQMAKSTVILLRKMRGTK